MTNPIEPTEAEIEAVARALYVFDYPKSDDPKSGVKTWEELGPGFH